MILGKYIRLRDDRLIILDREIQHATRAERHEVKSAGMFIKDGPLLVTMGNSSSLEVERMPDDADVLRRFFEQ